MARLVASERVLRGMTPQARRQLEAALEGAERAGLAEIRVIAGKAASGHVSHYAGTEWDIQGYTADGKLWSREQRVAVASAARDAGANRFGLYSTGRTLHMGHGPPGSSAINTTWGAGGLTGGEASRRFTNPAELAFSQSVASGRPFDTASLGIAPAQPAGASPDMVRMAQEYLNENGIRVPVSGQLDDATQAALKTWNATPAGAAFAERYGLQRPAEAPQSASQQLAFAPELQRTPAQTAIAGAMTQGDQPPAAPAAPRSSVRQVATSRFTDPSGIEYVQPPVQMAQAEQPPAFDVPPSGPGAMMGTPREAWAPRVQERAAPGSAAAAEVPRQFDLITDEPIVIPPPPPLSTAPLPMPPTTAPMMASPGGVPLAPASPYAANYSDRATGLPPQPLTWPGGVDYMRQQPVRSVNDLLAALPPSSTEVLPPPTTAALPGVPVSYAPPMPRPNPTPPGQRPLRSGTTPNGYAWQHIPQRGGPPLLAVTSPKGRKWTEVIGPPGGAGLFNEFASSFNPVRRG